MAPRVRGPRAAGQRDHRGVARARRRARRRPRREPPEVVRRARRGLLAVGRRRRARARRPRDRGVRARAAASNVDAVAAALTADGVSPHLAALHAAQRTGALDLHGLDPSEATRAVTLVLDHRDLLTDDVLVITGRGKHSQKGSVVKREVHELLTRRGAAFVEENEGAVRLQTRPVLWLDARRGGQDVASGGVVTVFLADEAAEAAGDVVTLVARGGDVVDGDGRCVGRIRRRVRRCSGARRRRSGRPERGLRLAGPRRSAFGLARFRSRTRGAVPGHQRRRADRGAVRFQRRAGGGRRGRRRDDALRRGGRGDLGHRAGGYATGGEDDEGRTSRP